MIHVNIMDFIWKNYADSGWKQYKKYIFIGL
jgi:hypothetical protein